MHVRISNRFQTLGIIPLAENYLLESDAYQ